MKSDGIGGAELAFVYPEVVDDPAKGIKNFAFLSSEMREGARHTRFRSQTYGEPAVSSSQNLAALAEGRPAVASLLDPSLGHLR